MTPHAHTGESQGMRRARLRVEGLWAYRAGERVLDVPLLSVWDRRILGVVGQSGSGKTTLLRILSGAARPDGDLRWGGRLELDGVAAAGLWPPEWSRRVGLAAGRMEPFPGTAAANVAQAIRPSLGWRARAEALEAALVSVGRGELVRDRRPAATLPVLDRRLVCLARALAVQPEVLLLDEPSIGLDPVAIATLDDVLRRLRDRLSLLVVGHNLHEIAALADDVAVVAGGRLGEWGPATRVFAAPAWPAAVALLHGMPVDGRAS